MTSSTAFVPLYFAAAWMAANRDLTDRLGCRIGLRQRAQIPSIWRYWLGDAVFSAIALPFALAASHLTTLFNTVEQDTAQKLSLAAYPIAYILIGLTWPKLSSISLGREGRTISIADFRDRFLGGPMIATINADVHRLVDDYLDRVSAAVRANPSVFSSWIQHRFALEGSGGDVAPLRAVLAESAAKDFRSLEEDLATIENIPFRERSKPLMKVPLMTWADEQVLYEAGICSVRRLYFARQCPTPRISPERWQVLRNNVSRLFWTRCKLGAAAFTVLIGAVAGSRALTNLSVQPVPYAKSAAPSPKSDDLNLLRNSSAYEQKGVHQ